MVYWMGKVEELSLVLLFFKFKVYIKYQNVEKDENID